jgi:hypothetical protein
VPASDAPSPLPGPSGVGSGVGVAGGLSAGGWAAILVALLACWAAQVLVRRRSVPVLWRPMAFVAILERPG